MTILLAQPGNKSAQMPEWVIDLQSFRRWATSDEYPTSGWYAHLAGNLWVDTTMERPSHNDLKMKIGARLTAIVEGRRVGRFFGDRMLLTHLGAELSTEPDGAYVSYESIRNGTAILRRKSDSSELEGTPDMVLEVISPTSVQKDTTILRKLYYEAGIREYWLIDPRAEIPRFEILVRTAQGYEAQGEVDGWTYSPVFGQSFQITTERDEADLLMYQLLVK